MRVAMVVPGGVDRSGERRVIPALLALIRRLAIHHDLRVFALHQEARRAEWDLAGARIHNVGARCSVPRAMRQIHAAHRSMPFDIVHAIWSGWSGLTATGISTLLRIPSLVHIAGGELASIPQIAYGGSRSWHGRAREAFTLRAASVITAASAPVIERLAELGFEAQRVPLGVDLSAWPARRPVKRDPLRRARLIHVASLNRVKDQTTLLRALALLAGSGVDFELDLIGEDTLHGEIQQLGARLGLAERVRFHGFLTQRQMRPIMLAGDLMVMSSLHETGPLVMLEAAVLGIPTVGTAVGHVREWSPHAAVSVPVGDAGRLAQAIAGLLANEELRMRLAHSAHQRALQEDADYTAGCFQRLYARLCPTAR